MLKHYMLNISERTSNFRLLPPKRTKRKNQFKKKHIKARREERKYGKAGREHKAKLDTNARHSPTELKGNR
jgi:hypothetical protein